MTVLVTVCADGTSIPSGVILKAKHRNLRDNWVDDISPQEEQNFVASSPSGWTNNELGLSWLRDVFDRSTKAKAGDNYRLLILDGHGSHITRAFIDYCNDNRILLAVFPPHSTHTLQPLDVVLFKPLSTAYSSQLSKQQQHSWGQFPVKKADFFSLYKAAYISSFTEKNIRKSFKATGIWPMDRSQVINRVKRTRVQQEDAIEASSQVSVPDWRHVDRTLKEVVKESSNETVKTLTAAIHRASTETILLRLENEGLKASLAAKNKRKSHGKILEIEGADETTGGFVFWSPSKVKDARAKRVEQDAKEHEEKLEKAKMKDLRKANKLYKEKIAKEKADKRVERKERKERKKAGGDEKARKKREEKERQNAIKSSKKGKATAVKASQKKPQRARGGGAARKVALEPAPLPPARTTKSGRTPTLPAKYR